MGFRPLHDWVLLKRSEPEEKTGGGIIIPDAARTKPTEGIVVAIGPGKFVQEKDKKEKKFVPTVLKPGQRVIFIDYMTKEVVLDGEEITLIQEDSILGVLESTGALAVKKQYQVEVKKEHPPMVQTERPRPESKKKIEVEVTFRKAVKTGKAIKQVKAEVKTNAKKSAAQQKEKKMKKTAKKAAPKKAAAKKAAPAKKTVAKKTVKKAVAKKAAPKKAVAKKAAPKKAVAKKAAPKKAVAKKAAPKKAAAKKK